MVAYNFAGRFASLVESRTKRTTIREKARALVGDRLQLYTGQRTTACRKLVDPDPVCDISMYVALRPGEITLGNVDRFPRDRDEFARMEGFADYREMHAWFGETYGTAFFVGRIIRWTFAEEAPRG